MDAFLQKDLAFPGADDGVQRLAESGKEIDMAKKKQVIRI
jgi:hypothetical protein